MLLLILFSYTIPFDSPIMDNIEYLQIKGLVDIPSIRPYESEWLVSQIGELLIKDTELNDMDRKIVSSFHPLLTKGEDFSMFLHVAGAYQHSPELSYGFLDARWGGKLTSSITYSQAVRIRRASEVDSFGPRPWKDFQGYLHEGLLTYDAGGIKCDIGRRNFLLGSGDENSLLLSLDPQGYDGFLIFIPFSYFEYYGIFSVLNTSGRHIPDNRYISIHRIGLDLNSSLKLGFSEALLFGKTIHPSYLNIFFSYLMTNGYTWRDDNIIWSFDAHVRLFNSIIFGEFVIDDIIIKDEPYPNKFAYKFGLKSLILNRFLVKMNYTFVDKWVYTHRLDINIYERCGYPSGIQPTSHPLGFPLGNDVDQLSFSIKFMNTYALYPHVAVNYIRKGEGSLHLPYEEEGGPLEPPFPSGIIEKQFEVKLGLDYTFKYNFYIEANIGKRYWTNFDHIEDNNRNEMLFDISFWVII